MSTLSISKAWDESRPIIGRDGRLFMAVALATVVLPGTLLFMLNPDQSSMSGMSGGDAHSGAHGTVLVSLIAAIISIIGSIAISYLALMPGHTVGDALRRGVKRLLPMIGAVLLLIIPIIIVGIVLAVVLIGADNLAAMNVERAEHIGPGAAIVFVLLFCLMVYLGVRLMMVTPVVAVEDVGPVGIIKRSWVLTRGHFLRLFGFLVLIAIAALVAFMAVGVVLGLIVSLVFGDIEPMSLAALVSGLGSTLVQALISILSGVMVARIYTQIAATPSVPDVHEA